MVKEKRVQDRLFVWVEGIQEASEKVFDIMLLSLLWLLFSLPLVTIGASLAALYHTTYKVIRGNRGYVFDEFVKSFRRNMKDGCILWAIIGGISFILQLNMGILYSKTVGLVGLFLICFYLLLACFFIGVAAFVFPILSRFDMNPLWILKLSLYLAFRHLPITVILVVLIAVVSGCVYVVPFSILMVPGIATLLCVYLIEPKLEKYIL